MVNQHDVVVLLGGNSAERHISLQSGAAVADALSRHGYPVRLLDPKEQSVDDFSWRDNSVAVIMLHGAYGEDGQVQAELEGLGIPFSGSDQMSSRLAFHKHAAKEVFRSHDLSTPESKCLAANDLQDSVFKSAEELGYPVVIKPEAQGSSIGVSIVRCESQLLQAVHLVREFGEFYLMEKAISGEEWTVPILDRQALPAIRISSRRTFFDYEAKYQDDDTDYVVIPQQDSEISKRVTTISLEACRALSTSGACRVDLIVDQDDQPWILEVNTVPGMTDHSLVPMSACAHGWSMSELCEQILFSALPNHFS